MHTTKPREWTTQDLLDAVNTARRWGRASAVFTVLCLAMALFASMEGNAPAYGAAVPRSAGGGVSGPGSSTDNAIAVWDGAGGDTLKDSNVIVGSQLLRGASSLRLQRASGSGVFLDLTSAGFTFGSSSTAFTNTIRGTNTTDLGSIATQTCTDVSVTVTGAAAGDDCLAGVSSDPDSNLSISCEVVAVDTCAVRLCNPTGAGIDPGSVTYSCRTMAP